MSPRAKADDDASLKRLPGGGGWQTRDGRFTIETASGTWSLLDAEQTDDLGLPLVRGPFRSLADAKAAIETARSSEPAAPSLAARTPAKPEPAKDDGKGKAQKKAPKAEPPEEPAEPRWITEIDPSARRRARRLVADLEKLGVRDPDGVVRRDLAGDVPAVARLAVASQVAEALADADAATTRVARRLLDVLVEGRDELLDVRWRLVDGEGRPIGLTADDVRAARKGPRAAD